MVVDNILPAFVLTDVSELLLVIICFFAIRIKLIRMPAILILISTVLDLLSAGLFRSEIKTLLIAIAPVRDTAAFIGVLHKSTDTIGELLNILGVAGLIAVVLRHNLHCTRALDPNHIQTAVV